MILASILITSEEHQDQPLSQKIIENIASFKLAHPGIEHRLFRGPEIREFLSNNYGRETLAAYDSLKPYAYKSDLARHCILLHHGGVYADLSVYFLRRWIFQEAKLGVFRDFLVAAPWQTANTLFFAPPGHKALAKAIELICANVKNRHYGTSVLCPTGPVSFGKAIAMTCEPEDLIVGDSLYFTPPPGQGPLESVGSHCFVFGEEFVAVKRKRGGGPQSDLGITGGNEYVDLWYKRDIYAPDGKT